MLPRWNMGQKWDETYLIALVLLWFSHVFPIVFHSPYHKVNVGHESIGLPRDQFFTSPAAHGETRCDYLKTLDVKSQRKYSLS